jgi:ligand-binding sensor domain-containing protein
VFSIVIDPKQPKVVYLSACSGIYKSEDGGAKFVKAPGIPSSARRTRVLMQDPNRLDTVFAGTTEGLYRTFDAGKYWMETTSPDVIVNDVYVDPTDSKHVLLATDRHGVLASDDGGDSFLPSNSGFSARQITAFVEDARHPAIVYVGVVNDKDSGGVFVSHTGGLSWSHLSDGLDGHDVFSLAQAPDGTILAGTEHGIYRLKEGAWQRVGDDTKADGVPVAPPAPGAAQRRPTHRRVAAEQRVANAHAATATLKNLVGSVYSFALSGETLYAATSRGVLWSASSGEAWAVAAAIPMGEWRWVAAAKSYAAAAGLDEVEMSVDGGHTWRAVALPANVTQISALSVDGDGALWIADRSGVYFSADRGATWEPLANLYVRNVNSLYYDGPAGRMLVTTNGPHTEAFAVETASKRVTSWDTGWNLRFLRPVGDHLVAATLFDGIVVQPRMVVSPEAGATSAQR